jgi:anti-sigma factor RsiW
MAHVTEKLAEFIFEELPAQEMAQARQHLSECSNCREQVERFQQTMSLLQASPDLEPPRNIVFDFEKPVARRFRQWVPAFAALAALIVMTIALAGRVHIQWQDSQLTVAFGQIIPAPQMDQTGVLAAEIERMKGHLAFLERQQQKAERDNLVIATKMEPMMRAQRSPAGD